MTDASGVLSEREVDEVLLQGVALKRDREALEALYLRYAEPILRYLLALDCPPKTAQQLAARVFADIWQRPHAWANKGLLKPWLLAVAHKAWLVETKRQSAHSREELPPQVQWRSIDPETLHDSAALRQAIALLPSPIHESFLLSELGHLSYSEIAEILRLNVVEVQRRIASARVILMQELGKEAGQTIELPRDDFLALSAYADGQTPEDHTAAMAAALDGNPTQMQLHTKIVDLHHAIGSLAPVRVLVPPFESLDQTLQAKENRLRGRRMRLAFELTGLIIALALAAAGWLTSHTEQRHSLHSAAFRLGLIKTPPPLPETRSGEALGFICLNRGAIQLTTSSQRQGLLNESGTLRNGETIALPDEAQTTVVFPYGSQIILKSGSAIQFSRYKDAVTCHINKGAAYFAVVPGDGKFHLEAGGVNLDTLAGEFAIAMGPAKEITKNLDINSSKQLLGTNASQPSAKENGKAQTKSGQAVRVTVLSGGVSAGNDTYAMMGETLYVDESSVIIADTPMGDASTEWAREQCASPPFAAVASLNSSCQALAAAADRKNGESVEETIEPFMALWPNLTRTEVVDRLTAAELRQIANLQIRSIRTAKNIVAIDVATADGAHSSILVMEKQEDGWRITRQIGNLITPGTKKAPRGPALPGDPWQMSGTLM